MKNVVQIAAKLYDARDSMRAFWADKYPEKMQEWKAIIKITAKRDSLDEMHATMKIVQRLQSMDRDTGMSQALAFAAYVEIVEPSQP